MTSLSIITWGPWKRPPRTCEGRAASTSTLRLQPYTKCQCFWVIFYCKYAFYCYTMTKNKIFCFPYVLSEMLSWPMNYHIPGECADTSCENEELVNLLILQIIGRIPDQFLNEMIHQHQAMLYKVRKYKYKIFLFIIINIQSENIILTAYKLWKSF